jgi:Nif-specific regulatory protein
VKLKNKELVNFASYISLTIIMELPQEITRRPSFTTLYKETIIKVAENNSNVLITGETGTGKGVIAKLIHDLSKRKNKPFVKINLTAITDTLMESELFGHEKGAFTGAIERRKGKFESAHEGTVFLDEIGEISPFLQVKILNVIQDKEFTRLGGNETIKCDFRLICATNQNLLEKIKDKSFREDLYYRINVHNIEIPPLREHTKDINILTDYFIDKYCTSDMEKIKNKALAIPILKEYDWPGNVRQLENTIEEAVNLSDNGSINIDRLIQKVEKLKKELSLNKTNSLKDKVEAYEWALIIEALKNEKGNKSRTAKRLGMARNTLNNKMKKYYFM